MRSTYEGSRTEQIEIQGRIVQGRDKIVPPPPWTWWARHLWPEKTAANLAAIANKDERTAKRWLSGEFEPPICVVRVLFDRMFESD